MGTIKTDTVTGLSSPTEVTLASNKFVGTASGTMTVVGEGGSVQTSLQQGLCKSWISFNGTGTPAARDSFNFSSLTDSATGKYAPVMATAMGNTNYSLAGYTNKTNGDSFYAGGGLGLGTNEFVSTSTTTYEVVAYASSDYIDATRQYSQVFGDLA